MSLKPLRFIQEQIEVQFNQQPTLEKKPGCPDQFSWRGEDYIIQEVLEEWHDYQRRGRMARNMQPQHAAVASSRGSWGVGLDNYRVCIEGGRYFDIYYDRAPKDADHRKGAWFLAMELVEDYLDTSASS